MYEDQERVLGNPRQSEITSIRLKERKYRGNRGIKEAKEKEEEDSGCC